MPNRSALICGIVLLAATCRPALPQTSPSIRDITAILDQEKPNVALLAKGKALAEAEPSRDLSPAALHAFYLGRGRARAELGDFRRAAEDGARSAKAGQGSVEVLAILDARSFAVLQLINAGEFKAARDQLVVMERDITNIGQGVRGRLINNYRWTITSLIKLGDLAQADGYFRRLTSLRAEARTWNDNDLYGGGRDSEVARARADLALAKGQYREAEAAYRSSIASVREMIVRMRSWPRSASTKENFEQRIDVETSLQARAKASQGRLAEAEADIRGALLSRLRANGKYAVTTANQIWALSSVISLQGRYAEAEQLVRAELEIRRAVGVVPDSESIITALRSLSSLCSLQERHTDAAQFDAEITALIKSWDAKRRQRFDLDGSQIYSLFATGRIGDGVTAAQTFVTREIARLGETHPDVALARGMLATGYAKAGRDAEALAEFRKSVPALLAAKRATDVDESAVLALRNSLIRNIVESYAGVLVRSKKDGGEDTEGQAFQLIDAIRGRAVHQAVMASTARMVVRDKALADLVRNEQDQEKQIDARLSLVNNLLARAPDERDDRMVSTLNKEIDGLRAARKNNACGYCSPLSDLRGADRPEAPLGGGHARRAAAGRGADLVLFRSRAELCVGAAQGGTLGVRLHCRDGRGGRRQNRRAAQGVGARCRKDFAAAGVRSGAGLRSLRASAEAGRGRLARFQKPDHRHKRGAGTVAARLAADIARRAQSRRRTPVRRVPRCAVAVAHAGHHAGAFGHSLESLAAVAARLVEPGHADRLRRSLFQRGASRRGRA